MRVVWLAWCICGVCLLLALSASAITYHPDFQRWGVVSIGAFGVIALVAGGVAVGLGRLPANHRVQFRSVPLTTEQDARTAQRS